MSDPCYRLQEAPLSSEPVLRVPHLPICPTLNALVSLEAVLNSTNEVQPFVDQILVIARLMVTVIHESNLHNLLQNDPLLGWRISLCVMSLMCINY